MKPTRNRQSKDRLSQLVFSKLNLRINNRIVFSLCNHRIDVPQGNTAYGSACNHKEFVLCFIHRTFYVRQTRLTLDVGYSRDIQKHINKGKINTITHWLGCSRRGQQKTRNRDAILLPVSSRWRSKPESAKVNGNHNVKTIHLPLNEPTKFTIFCSTATCSTRVLHPTKNMYVSQCLKC